MDLCHSFDINDPNTNLESLVRVTGSLSPDNSTIAYINGTVYYRLPGETAKKILNFEGYNINRKEREKEGNYMSLSCEFVVYRDPVTSEILKVWMNPMTSQPNEVFAVQNDPVDAVFVLGDVIKTVHASSEQLAFELNIDLSYPNVLGPQKYPKFSAGDTYKGTELFTYLSNYTELSTSQSDSVPFFGTWQRSSQFLPWMEMGTTPGHLIYNTFFWKCDRGLACIADDILELIRSDGLLKYLTAPVWYEVPNDTSWSVFKSKIDARRAANLSDIIIPMVNSTGHPIINLPQVDRKIVSLLENQKHIPFRFNGSVFTSLNGNQIDLYRLEGNATATVSFNASASQHEPYMTIQCKYSGYYRNASSGVVITTWTNPLTNRSLDLPDVYGSEFISFDRNDIYTNDIPDNDVIGLIGVSSTTQGQKLPDDEIWTVSMPVLAFPLPVVVDVPRFYGTWTIFSNYPAGWDWERPMGF
ncbi:uncharacterized protein LOC132548127 [Ylistrum balloti]|uniref:uncharacterized protein LOC132548127 n=1 Tax=Ylistrum balloti TaxID=509963 RepID=UPI002905AA22|nr:uncharacterized protein LOC132548127 [Ylistrum balloti]